MNEQQKLDYNKMCAEFLGWKQHEKFNPAYFTSENGGWWEKELKFHSDLNWIMEVKNKICQLDIVDEFNVQYCSVAGGYYCSIFPAFKNSFQAFYTKTIDTEKEAVLQIMNEFLTWYKDNK